MADAFADLVQRLAPGSRLLRDQPLKGGVSAEVTALEIQRPTGETHKWLVRRHGEADLRRDPDIARHECQLLQMLHAAGLPTPKPYGVEQPYLVVEFIEGEPVFAPVDPADTARQMAFHLARIHGLAGPGFLPQHAERCAALLRNRPDTLDESLDEGRIRRALEAAWPLPPRNRPTLLHGDYWPGNILWQDGQVVGIIDWEDAFVGDPLADVANTRLEILWAYGPEAMQCFTEHYQALAPIDFDDLPYWDLLAALRPAGKLGQWAVAPAAEALMRERHRWFVDRACAGLP